MCGRFTQYSDVDRIIQQFNTTNRLEITPSYNITPGNDILAITHHNHNQRKLFKFRWGLIPSWTKDDRILKGLINARAETIQQKPSYRAAFKHRRCLIIADGFYEWQTKNKHKIPFYICEKNNQLFAFAGVWEYWQSAQRKVVWSCTIITTNACDALQSIHDRMPAIIPPQRYDDWLNVEETRPDRAHQLLQPYPSIELNIYPVSSEVNSPLINNVACIRPIKR